MPSQNHAKLVLASRSPRRRELLMEAGYDFEVVVPDEAAECGVCSRETAEKLVARLARQKAANVVQKIARRPWVPAGAHWWVWFSVAIPWPSAMGKSWANRPMKNMPARCSRCSADANTACSAGFVSGKCPVASPRSDVAVTRLKMDRLSAKEIDDYLASGLWEGKAGAFGYQDRLGWIQVVEGSEIERGGAADGTAGGDADRIGLGEMKSETRNRKS